MRIFHPNANVSPGQETVAQTRKHATKIVGFPNAATKNRRQNSFKYRSEVQANVKTPANLSAKAWKPQFGDPRIFVLCFLFHVLSLPPIFLSCSFNIFSFLFLFFSFPSTYFSFLFISLSLPCNFLPCMFLSLSFHFLSYPFISTCYQHYYSSFLRIFFLLCFCHDKAEKRQKGIPKT